MDFLQMALKFIRPELLIMIPALWYIGVLMKGTKQIPDWQIPFIILALSIIFATSWVIMTMGMVGMSVWVGIMQGIIIAMVQGQFYQYFKQLTDKKET